MFKQVLGSRLAATASALVGVLLLAACTTADADSVSAPAASPSPTRTAPTEPAFVPTGTKVDPRLFGTHVLQIARGNAPIPAHAGAIRLWDSGVAWRQVEPKQGQINWAAMDQAVSSAEQTGARQVVWVMGSPPKWAAKDPTASGLYGDGTSSPPSTKAYLNILTKVASRYKGRITAYQVWNEANIKIFYRGGSAEAMAKLTDRAYSTLKAIDPAAQLVGASTTVRRDGPVKDWYEDYLAALAKRDWPVDVLSVHLYPIADQGAGTRAAYIRMIRPWLKKRGWTGPVWDTEVNYGDRRDFAKQIVIVPQARAAGWVARTYIDSLALGIDQVFWYSWNDHLLGIDQLDPSTGWVTPAGQAYLTVQEWFKGAWWQGCTGELVDPTGKSGATTTCKIQYGTGQKARILFSHGGATTVAMPRSADQICQLDGSCVPPTGDRLAVGSAPVLVRLAAP